MRLIRAILPKWAEAKFPTRRRVVEGTFSDERIQLLNIKQFYNIYSLPNYPSDYTPGVTVEGADIDCFEWVLIDCDLKDGLYTKESFIDKVCQCPFPPTRLVDSGNGVHAYWRVTDLDAPSYLRLSRRLMRHFKTDPAVGQIYQLMRLPGTVNTKHESAFQVCQELAFDENMTYRAEELDLLLPPLTPADEDFCQQHFTRTYRLASADVSIPDKMPLKWAALVRANQEVRAIWSGEVDDRSRGDYRLGHIMFAHGFTKEEATAVLVNAAKALARAPVHRMSYALNIVDKIWAFEEAPGAVDHLLSSSVKDLLAASSEEELKGTRFPCHDMFDGTERGFRLGQVLGLVAGTGVGKTTISLNMFYHFVQNNPNFIHLFVSLEMPAREIANQWSLVCGMETHLHEKVRILDNYNEDGSYRHLSLEEVQTHVLEIEEKCGIKVGAVVIDHIGILKKKNNRNGENEGLIGVCQGLKSFAIATNTFVIIQSQSSREKASLGDIEISKDAAYGTQFFESFVDFLFTIWQPLKRCYENPACPRVTAIKLCKIRAKHRKDRLIEDQRYMLYYDQDTGRLRELTQDEEKAFDFFNKQCVNLRKKDRKTDVLSYTSLRWGKEQINGAATDSGNPGSTGGT